MSLFSWSPLIFLAVVAIIISIKGIRNNNLLFGGVRNNNLLFGGVIMSFAVWSAILRL